MPPNVNLAPLRVAVVGVGGMAHWQHLPNLRALADRARIVAMVDIDEVRLAETAAAYDVSHTYTSVRDLLRARLDLEAALVLTPATQHALPAIELMRAGVPVFCEKPLAYDLQEAEEMVRVAAATNSIFMVAFNRRFAATLRAVKETLGWAQPQQIFVEKSKPMEATARQRILEVSIHVLDLLRWLAGSAVANLQVMSALDAESELEQSVAALIRFENGVIGVFAMNAGGAKWVERIEVFADGATMIVEYPVRLRRFVRSDRPLSAPVGRLLTAPPATLEIGHLDDEPILQLAGTLYPVDEAAALGFLAELEHFIDCVRTGAQPLTSGVEALATQRLAHQIQQEAR